MHQILQRIRRAAMAVVAGACAAGLAGGCATPDSRVSGAPSPPEGRESTAVEQALYEQLARWKGTRYRLGGTGEQGMDCSGLTYVVYRDLFDRQLPRTATEQTEVGRAVPRGALQPGDLVFFKTGAAQRHVGIYVADGMFLHASRSSGVRLSSLGHAYWRDRYWKARRLDAVPAAF